MAISNETRSRVKAIFEPIALAMGRLGLSPDALTLIGFAITAAGAALLAAQLWLAGGIVVFLGGAFDMFDGTLARATGKVSKLGAFMDSVFDRWGEALVYVGIVWGCVAGEFALGALLAAAAMASAFLVSYARAKSEGLGFTAGTGMAAVGLAPREIRLVVLSVGLVAAGVAGGVAGPAGAAWSDLSAGRAWLALALGLIALAATATVVQRILHVRAQARGGGPGPIA
ncbi:MAG: putative phosphatidylinositol synthase [Chloroflexi bacterium]|jgi:CDP-diacylglycerol--glycerol-3-phosphate 3-phosphatidyltransferase|nr:putative phosphatidylinositol synthase [Chloroflexota bacterium]